MSGTPFLLLGQQSPPSPGQRPEGHYDEEDQVWKQPDGSLIDYSLTLAGRESTHDTTLTKNGADTSGDHVDSD